MVLSHMWRGLYVRRGLEKLNPGLACAVTEEEKF